MAGGFKIIESFIGLKGAGEDWLTSSTGSGATADATESGNIIDTVTLTAGGSNFSSIPTVTITGSGGGSGAVVKASITNGVVTSLNLISGGTGYSGTLTVVFTTGGFSLPESFPDSLMTFLHLDFNLNGIAAAVSVFKNGVEYSLNNGNDLEGTVFRSLPISKGDVFQFQSAVSQPTLQFTLALEQ